jgi:hypothetical protein
VADAASVGGLSVHSRMLAALATGLEFRSTSEPAHQLDVSTGIVPILSDYGNPIPRSSIQRWPDVR